MVDLGILFGRFVMHMPVCEAAFLLGVVFDQGVMQI